MDGETRFTSNLAFFSGGEVRDCCTYSYFAGGPYSQRATILSTRNDGRLQTITLRVRAIDNPVRIPQGYKSVETQGENAQKQRTAAANAEANFLHIR